MMVESVEINSEFEFLIVGPIASVGEGILLKSNSTLLDMVAAANQLYHKRLENVNILDAWFHAIGMSSMGSIGFIWSRPFSLGLNKRNSKLLLVWRRVPKSNDVVQEYASRFIRNKDEINDVEEYLKEQFNRFIENSFKELEKISFGRTGTDSDPINNSKILWDLSPLIMACMAAEILKNS